MWLFVLSAFSSLTLVLTLAMCLCWGKKTPKNEWLGLDGMVTQKNPDENVNHLPNVNAQTIPDGIVCYPGDDVDCSKRLVAANNPRRSLPDIPSDGGVRPDGDTITYDPNGDNSSDLYATVEPYQNSTKRHTIANGIDAKPSISQHSSISQADSFSPYARVKEHPYDKLRKTEHPYASVQPSSSKEQDENSSGEATPRTSLLRVERASTSLLLEPVAPPRSRTSSVHSGVTADIPAASAVAGGIAANQELPYMTPPIVQQNFSGDSQDSSKGYTSISVREPLANIRAQTKELKKVQNDLDPHYATVSDDSDEGMYTTIPDPNNSIYTSGSETYAQIQPPVQLTVVAEINPAPSSSVSCDEDDEIGDGLYEPAPPPPSVDSLKNVTAHTHSRQASSSSSVGILGSPKPEKRQANSPLPPPPAVSPDLRLPTEKLSGCKNLDDMYAKINKNRKRSERDDLDGLSMNRATLIDMPCSSRHSLPNENSPQKSIYSTSSAEERRYSNGMVQSSQKNVSTFNTESYLRQGEHNYETIRISPRKNSDPGYEKLRLKENNTTEPGYDTINGPASLISSDPGYEVLKLRSNVVLEIDPNYEELQQRAPSIAIDTANNELAMVDGYSVVNKQRKLDSSYEDVKSRNSSSYESDVRDPSSDEPNYESMPSESLSEHNYAALKSTGSESDPNYDSVNHNDPNYESVKYLDLFSEDPPYEHLQDEDSSKTDSDLPGYERIRPKNGEVSGDYEKFELDVSKRLSDNSASVSDGGNYPDPRYETVKSEKLDTIESSTSSELSESDENGIVQV